MFTISLTEGGPGEVCPRVTLSHFSESFFQCRYESFSETFIRDRFWYLP